MSAKPERPSGARRRRTSDETAAAFMALYAARQRHYIESAKRATIARLRRRLARLEAKP